MPNPIARVELNAFLPFVMAACPDLPQDMAIGYLRQAAIDFCQRSGVLRRTALINQQRSVTHYPVWPDDCEQVVRVNEVCVNGCCYRGVRDRCGFRHGGARYSIDEGFLRVSSVPQEDRPATIEVRFAAAPTRDGCEVDAVLLDDWQEAIEDGALARLYLLSRYAFSSQALAAVRSRSYADHIRRARLTAMKGDMGDTALARAPTFV